MIPHKQTTKPSITSTAKITKEKEEKTEKAEKPKKKGHGKSNSIAEDFAFSNVKVEQVDTKYVNFANTKIDDLLTGIKNSSTSKVGLKSNEKKEEKTLQKHTQSSQQFKTPSLDPSFVSQVDKKEEKVDLQQLTNTEDILDFYDYTENCLNLINKMSIPPLKEIEHLQIELPSKLTKKKLAIFDLDETLIHCELKNLDKADKVITIKLKNGSKARIGLNIRPNYKSALAEIGKHFNMIIYTASDQSYADSVVNYIDPSGEFFKYRLYRHNCVEIKLSDQPKPFYVKDLRIIKNVMIENMIIIDNSVLSFAFHLENGIPILPYYQNKDDVEMDNLKNYLSKLAKCDNIQVNNGATFNLKALLEEAESISQRGGEENSFMEDNNQQNDNKHNSGNKDKTVKEIGDRKLHAPQKKNSLQAKIFGILDKTFFKN